MLYGLTITSGGHFARVSSGLASELEIKNQVEPRFSGTGLKLATTGSVSWTAGAAGDRFECLVGGLDSFGGTFTLDLNTSDSFADGPWPAPAPPPAGKLDSISVLDRIDSIN